MLALVSAAIASCSRTSAAREDERAAPPESRQESTRRPLALTVNPLGFIIERYGGNVEWSPAPHHALIASGYMQSLPVGLVRPLMHPITDHIRVGDGSTSPAFGGEIGYRLYSGKNGPEGIFLGCSFVAMPFAYLRAPQVLTIKSLPNYSVEVERVYGYGGAIDFGAQTITSFGLTVGGGIGASLLSYDMPQDDKRLPIAMPPILPRLLLSMGYAF